MKRKLLYSFLAVLCLLIITNPSASSFKEHLGKTSYNGLVRQYNFFLFSRYIDEEDGTVYTGVLGNFLEVNQSRSVADYSHNEATDTTHVDSISKNNTIKGYSEPVVYDKKDILTEVMNKKMDKNNSKKHNITNGYIDSVLNNKR